jgi:hypothetical protein
MQTSSVAIVSVEVVALEISLRRTGAAIPLGEVLGFGADGLPVRSPCAARVRRLRCEPTVGTFVVELEPTTPA